MMQNVPGIGGQIKVGIEDFQVEEIPAYEPSGQGPHYYLWVEKRDVDARSLLSIVAEYFNISTNDVGAAGAKDRRAITGQWISIPARGPEPEPGLIAEGVEILRVSRHGNKLRTGHLKGNHFRLRIRNVTVEGDLLIDAVTQIAHGLKTEGLPNYFGLQRFGDKSSTLKAGWKWMRSGQAPRDRFLRRMAASAIQSEVFNRVLVKRIEAGTHKTALSGDIFEKVDSGGRFWVDDADLSETQSRLDAGEIAVTGPMPGSRQGVADGKAGEIESEVLAGMGLTPESFKCLGRNGRGTRRPLTVGVEELSWDVEEPDAIRLEFSLPSGSYATVLLREFTGV